MRRLKEWEVTIFLVETEGDETSTRPWYTKDDINQILRNALHRAGKMRDIEIRNIYSVPQDEPYFPSDKSEVPF